MVVPEGEAVEVGFELEVLEVDRDAEHEAALPPLLPEHAHDQGPEPLTADAEPVAQRLVVGALAKERLLDAPQEPLTTVVAVLAEQSAVLPPLVPLQFQYQGPLPSILEAEPVEQKLSVGALLMLIPLEEPQEPLTVPS
jgi:hypothetical protein